MAEPTRAAWPLRYLTLLMSTVSRLLPARLTDALSAVLARFVYWAGHARHTRVLQDFRDHVDPTAQTSGRKWHPVRAMYRAIVRNTADGVWFLTASPAAVRRRFQVADPAPIAAALTAGRAAGLGVLVVFPHLGSYAAVPVVLALNGVPTTVVANRQPAIMQWVIDRGARRAGLELVVVDRAGGTSITAEMAAALRRGRVVAVAGDYFRARAGGGSGVPVELAGTRRTVGPGPALLALRTGATIVPAAIVQHGHRREPLLGAPIAAGGPLADDDPALPDRVAQVSQRIADAMGRFVEAAPEQWLMPGGLVSDSFGRRIP